MDARLAYRNKGDPDDDWKPYAASVVERILDCSIDDVNIIILDNIIILEYSEYIFIYKYFFFVGIGAV